MMYPYLVFENDDTEVVHSHILERNGGREVEVHFERSTDKGFDTARCVLPSYTWIIKKGYSEQEINAFTEFVRNHAHLLYRYAETGGLKLA